MKNLLKIFFLSFFTFAVNSTNYAQEIKLKTFGWKTAKEAQHFFHYSSPGSNIISGHRGGILKDFPENSLEAFENTLKYTPAFFEVDPRLTKDGVVVLMHDETLDRTTNGSGKISEYKFDELQKLRLKDKDGNMTPYKIPTLEEAIRWSKGKTILNLDNKGVSFEIIDSVIKKSDNPLIMISVHNLAQAKFYLKRNPDIILMLHILSKEAFDLYDSARIPWKNVIGFIGKEFTDENRELLKLIHQKEAMCMISTAPTFDKFPEKTERAKAYRKVFSEGADIIESDYPIEVFEALKTPE